MTYLERLSGPLDDISDVPSPTRYVITMSNIVHDVDCFCIARYRNGEAVEAFAAEESSSDIGLAERIRRAMERVEKAFVTADDLRASRLLYRACRLCCPDIPSSRPKRDYTSKPARNLSGVDIGRTCVEWPGRAINGISLFADAGYLFFDDRSGATFGPDDLLHFPRKGENE